MSASLLIVNPRAGGGESARLGLRLERRLSDGGMRVTRLETAGPGDARAMARGAAEDGLARVLVAGGDGTLHEAAAGLLDAPGDASSRPILVALPLGTGNDYVKMLAPLRRPEDIAAAEALCVSAIELRVGERRVGIAINNVGLGFLAEATDATEARHARAGRRGGGKLAYVLGGLSAAWGHAPVVLEARLDGLTHEGPFSLAHFGLGRYCGGGIDLAPEARLEAEAMAVCLVRGRSRLGLAWLWPRLERGGGAERDGVFRRRCANVTLTGGELRLHCDGEMATIDARGGLELRVLARALRVLAWRPDL